MSDIKQVQIIIRVSKEERSKIKEMAQYNGISVNEFIKNKVFSDIENQDTNDSNNDINLDIIQILKEQLQTKDMQIANLQQIIYNRDTKLLEAPKPWWKFWK
ncbi:plasmid mobilization protein [Streptococcus suis]|uniref:plasmid mobilization protein n=1 Tax=Streptococcus suis TaxID=1307 RepID=UPI000CF598A7|nr:DUF6290 family protein [Streptococcus suis]